MQYQFGDIVLVSFPFTEDGTVKNRPGLVLLDSDDEDLVVGRLTSQPLKDKFDLIIEKWKEAGLLLPSTARLSKFATISKNLVKIKLGVLLKEDLEKVKITLSSLWCFNK